MRLDPREVQQQIANLLLEYPDLKDDAELRLDMLEAETDIMELLPAALKQIDNAEFWIEGADKRIDELKARQQRLDLQVTFLRALILKIMRSADLRKIILPVATLSQRMSQQKLIGDPDVTLLPEELVKIERSPDRKKIREALLRGESVPECTLSNAEPSLSIYPR